jgi:hypothetical protein
MEVEEGSKKRTFPIAWILSEVSVNPSKIESKDDSF